MKDSSKQILFLLRDRIRLLGTFLLKRYDRLITSFPWLQGDHCTQSVRKISLFANRMLNSIKPAEPQERFFLTIQFEADEVKAAYLKMVQSRIVFQAVARQSLASNEENMTADAIRTMLSWMNITEEYTTLVSIPRNCVSIHILHLPATDRSELEQMIRLELQSLIPLDLRDLVFDYQVAGQTTEGYSTVNVIIALRKNIERYLSILQQAGLDADELLLDTEALFNLIRSNNNGAAPEEDQNVITVNVDAKTCRILASRGEHLLASERIPLAWESLNHGSEEEIADRIISNSREMARLINSFVNLHPDLLPRVQIAHVMLLQQSFNALFDEKILNRELSLPLSYIHNDELMDINSGEIGSEDMSLEVLGGMTQSLEIEHLSLLPKEVAYRKRTRFLLKKVSTAAFYALIALGLGFGLFYEKLLVNRYHLEYLNQQIEQVRPLAERIEKIKTQVDAFRSFLALDNSVLDLLVMVEKKIPSTMWLSHFEFEKNSRVIIRGLSPDMRNVIDLVSELESLPLLSGAEIKRARKLKTSDSAMVDFEITAELVSGERMNR